MDPLSYIFMRKYPKEVAALGVAGGAFLFFRDRWENRVLQKAVDKTRKAREVFYKGAGRSPRRAVAETAAMLDEAVKWVNTAETLIAEETWSLAADMLTEARNAVAPAAVAFPRSVAITEAVAALDKALRIIDGGSIDDTDSSEI